MISHQDLRGRTAVVTGGASGIGAALAAELSFHGVSVVVADIDEGGAAAVAANVRSSGDAVAVPVDVTDPDSVAAMADAADDRYGSVELLCSNAGVLVFGNLADATVNDWRWMSAVNVEGLLNCVDAFLPRMVGREGWRHIAATASTHAFIPGAGGTALYSVTKHAVFTIISRSASNWPTPASALPRCVRAKWPRVSSMPSATARPPSAVGLTTRSAPDPCPASTPPGWPASPLTRWWPTGPWSSP